MEAAMNNFTPRAQQVLALARKEADRFHHNFVGTEHLLLGLIRLGQGVAVNVLQKRGVNLEKVRTDVEKQVGKGPEPSIIGNIPYTPRVKKVLAMAAKESAALNHTYVGTEHLLLGVLREGDGVAARVLRQLGVEAEQLREDILKELDPNYGAGSADRTLDSPVPEPPCAPQVRLHATVTDRPVLLDAVVDTSKRYDVYCWEGGQTFVVYRNALFKSAKALLSRIRPDPRSEFLELELSGGKSVYVARSSIVKFCQAGADPGGEEATR